jgi:hypothetical protein
VSNRWCPPKTPTAHTNRPQASFRNGVGAAAAMIFGCFIFSFFVSFSMFSCQRKKAPVVSFVQFFSCQLTAELFLFVCLCIFFVCAFAHFVFCFCTILLFVHFCFEALVEHAKSSAIHHDEGSS